MRITSSFYSPAFTSFSHRELHIELMRKQREAERIRQRELEHQRELARQRELERQRKLQEEIKLRKEIDELNNNVMDSLQYRGLTEPLCDSMAAFMLNFTCSMMMESEHNMEEFFGSDEEYEAMQDKLSPECRQVSKELRTEIKNLKMNEDPIFGLITVNRLKDYLPDEGILTDNEYKAIADTTKFACSTLIKKCDLEQFDDYEQKAIKDLTGMVDGTEGLDFGVEYEEKLRELIDKVNKRQKAKIKESEHINSFIPPVEVRYLEEERDIEKERDLERC